jgi:dCMP deaminase
MTEKWDRRFLALAAHVATWSKDPSSQVGAVIVRPDKSIASLGFNGFPRGLSDDEALYNDRESKYARVVHAEMNAVLSAHEPVRGFTLYCSHPVCERCAVHLIQTGLARVVWPDDVAFSFQERWAESTRRSVALFTEAGIETRGWGGQ